MKALIATFVGAGVFAGGVALAHGWNGYGGYGHWGKGGMQGPPQGMHGPGPRYGMRFHAPMMGMAGPGRLFREEMQQARIQVLAELSGQSVGQIEKDIEAYSMRALLQKYNINFEKMQTLMHAKVAQIVQKAAEEGRITADEAAAINSHMSTGPHGPRGVLKKTQ